MTHGADMANIFELDMFGPHAAFHHLGLAVKSIKNAVTNDVEIVSDEIQRVSVAFVRMNGINIELIEPLAENTPITSSLKRDVRLVHMCFTVPDIREAIQRGRANGFHCIAKPVPAVAFGGKQIAWLFSKTYGLVELLEE